MVDGEITWGVILTWGKVNRLGVGGKYVCCLVIVAVYMGLERAKR